MESIVGPCAKQKSERTDPIHEQVFVDSGSLAKV